MSKKIKFEQVKAFYKDVAEFIPEGAELERRNDTTAEIKAQDNMTIEAVFSTPSTDREGDLIYPLGAVTDYWTGTILFNHDLSALPIGRCDNFSVTPKGIEGKIKLSETYGFARDVYGLVKEGILQGISIGFIPLEVLTRGTRAFSEFVSRTGLAITEATERIISKFEVIEVSITPVGCNRDALIYGLASKSLVVTDDKTKEVFGLDKIETKTLVDLQTKNLEMEAALIETKTALEAMQTKAVESPAKHVLSVSFEDYIKILSGKEDALTIELNDIWGDASTEVAKIDRTKPIEVVSTDLGNILDSAASKADDKVKAEVQKIADDVWAGYTTNRDGSPIKDIESIDKLKGDFVRDYLNQMQPDNKPYQSQSIDEFKNNYLRAAQAGTEAPKLDMSESNATTANLSIFGAQKDFLSALIEESGSGDLVQVRGLDDEKLCDVCADYIDQFLSVSGKSENFESVASAEANGWGHPNCRCILEPVAPATEAAVSKSISKIVSKALSKAAVDVAPVAPVVVEAPKPQVMVKVCRVSRPKVELTQDMIETAKALAMGKLV